MKTRTLMRLAALAFALGLTAGPASAAAIHGALFTSDTAGDVNVNIYDSKADVYLNGGPKNDNCAAAGVDDGTYVYQITNPNGDTLLSTDTIDHRQFTVTDGVITAVNDHPTVPGDCGSLRLQVAPFNDTPNNGGEYKAWITRLSDYIANGNTFKPGSTKTDNFKVKIVTEPEVGGITIYKFYDANGNGVWDSEEPPLFGWQMSVSGAGTGLTQSPDGLITFSGLSLDGNPYAVSEGNGGARWVQSVSLINGAPSGGSPESPVSVTVVAGENTQVDFGNYCTCTVKPYEANFWYGPSGETKLNDGGTMKPEFTLLRNANLRNPNGSHFNFNLLLPEASNYAILSTWLMSSSTNEAFNLSVQLAVLKLNVEAGFNRTSYYFKGYGTIAQIIADANTMLSVATCGANCNTTTADPLGQDQHDLAALIAGINAGTTVIMPKPCAYKFTLPTN
ncbi:MAG: hypothetical protein ACJ8GK_11340 [Luteimonas sp.]